MPIQQTDNTRVASTPKPTGSYTHYDPKAPKTGATQDTGTITEDTSNPIRRAIQNYTATYLNSNFANSPFMDVMRWLPGLSYMERVVTGQPAGENESLSMVMPMKGVYKRNNRINIDDYRQELEDAGIYFKQNKPIYKDPIQDTYELANLTDLEQWGKNYIKQNKKIFRSKKALDLDIERKEPRDVTKPTWKLVWDNYVSAMDRRRHNYFYDGIRTGDYPPYMYIDKSSSRPSVIFGFGGAGEIFTPSHFAPSDLKSGYRMLESLANEPRPVLFAVPDDLSKQLAKLGYTKIGASPQPFGEEMVMKNFMVNKNFSLEDIDPSLRKFIEVPTFEIKGKHYFSNNPVTGLNGITIIE